MRGTRHSIRFPFRAVKPDGGNSATGRPDTPTLFLRPSSNGQSEVGNGDSPGIAGDPNGRGEAYVFGIDGDTETLCYVLLVDKVQLVPVPAMMAPYP